MNSKLIQQILSKKHEAFVASITDPVVRDLVDKNSIITGGSIVSLLTNEPVNDYDYYFTNKATATAVANYYVQQFNTLHPDRWPEPIVHLTEDRVTIHVESAGIVSEKDDAAGLIDAEGGGSETDTDEAVADKDENKPKYRPVFLSSNAITLSDKVQLVIRFFGDPEQIHKNYDYVHCCNYWLSSTGKLVLHPKALESILTKNLFYQGSLYPICSLIRMRKFIKRGWHINAGQILKMCFQVSELDLSDIRVLREQLVGVDALYFHQVLDYCKKRQEEDPSFKVTAPYLVEVLDQIFG